MCARGYIKSEPRTNLNNILKQSKLTLRYISTFMLLLRRLYLFTSCFRYQIIRNFMFLVQLLLRSCLTQATVSYAVKIRSKFFRNFFYYDSRSIAVRLKMISTPRGVYLFYYVRMWQTGGEDIIEIRCGMVYRFTNYYIYIDNAFLLTKQICSSSSTGKMAARSRTHLKQKKKKSY